MSTDSNDRTIDLGTVIKGSSSPPFRCLSAITVEPRVSNPGKGPTLTPLYVTLLNADQTGNAVVGSFNQPSVLPRLIIIVDEVKNQRRKTLTLNSVHVGLKTSRAHAPRSSGLALSKQPGTDVVYHHNGLAQQTHNTQLPAPPLRKLPSFSRISSFSLVICLLHLKANVYYRIAAIVN